MVCWWSERRNNICVTVFFQIFPRYSHALVFLETLTPPLATLSPGAGGELK